VWSRPFIENVKVRLGFLAKGRDVIEGSEEYQLRESSGDYKALFEVENEDIGLGNAYFWDLNPE